MNHERRLALKRRIEEDLDMLIVESWDSAVARRLEEILNALKDTALEGYDD